MLDLRPTLRRLALAVSGVVVGLVAGTAETENAVANGDTRSLTIFHTHTQESATITFKRDGRYDRAALDQLNWLLRDWRINEPTKMDPRLFDTVWEAYRQVGSGQAIHIVSAYRSPGTNAMLRRRSKMVAEYSQHMLGKAMDFYLPDVPIDRIREVGLRMQRGGVGWYPHAGTPFIHLDVGSVRMWPRMTHDQLARLFPDGKTVLLPSDNRPFPRYEEAKAEILARGGTVAGITTQMAGGEEEDGPGLFGFLASLFGGGKSEPAPAPSPEPVASKNRRVPVVAVASADPQDSIGTRTALAYAAPAADDALRGSLVQRELAKAPAGKAADAKALLTAPGPVPTAEAAIAAVIAPLPPRRPSDLAAVMAALTMPLPPPRPVQFAALSGGMANLPAAAEIRAPASPNAQTRIRALIAPDADSKVQLRALFEAVSAGPVAAPAGRSVPVRIAATRLRDAAPDAVVAAAPERTTTRFSTRSPGDDLTAARFTRSAERPTGGR
ncbi:Uncharacterized conserved protein YcbK, DUF882 family [Methylobacterium phyllostachyos]|uniref:Murein endopeptidase K n=1 Tax=Methylobacterium phyllostachyos TaxID=582672 RepID=A0A1G9ZF27_9HYPH|nr:DUF882 domain-containing protein [Methylobacterium phyllostachyos]SDN19747.1 Uncharacterized conserved protein YcbK, DUF882 family [Methylobacterium phyllostachyos]